MDSFRHEVKRLSFLRTSYSKNDKIQIPILRKPTRRNAIVVLFLTNCERVLGAIHDIVSMLPSFLYGSNNDVCLFIFLNYGFV